jgi:hypothetical protein
MDVLRQAVTSAMMEHGKTAEQAASLMQHISDSYIGDLRWEAEQPEGDLNDCSGMVAHQVAEGAAEHFGMFPEVVEPLRAWLVAVGEAYIKDTNYVPHDVKEAGLTEQYLSERTN